MNLHQNFYANLGDCLRHLVDPKGGDIFVHSEGIELMGSRMQLKLISAILLLN